MKGKSKRILIHVLLWFFGIFTILGWLIVLGYDIRLYQEWKNKRLLGNSKNPITSDEFEAIAITEIND